MGAVTYPDQQVKDFIARNMVPVQLLNTAEPETTIYNASWTPLFIVLDPEGKEHQRNTGFLPPDEFIPFLILGIGKMHFDQENFEKAIECFEQVLNEYPDSEAAPEAFYFRGVSRFEMSHDASDLKEIYEEIREVYPESEWAKKAEPYRLI